MNCAEASGSSGDEDGSEPGDEPAVGQPERGDRRAEARLARSAARLAAVQALYQMEITGASAASVRREFEDIRLGAEIDGVQYREANIELFRAIIGGVVENQREIDRLTDDALVERWPLGRIDPTLRAIFRAAGCELLTVAATPPKVAITEYVEVAKAFFDSGQEARFVNAVLDHMARRARPDAFSPSDG